MAFRVNRGKTDSLPWILAWGADLGGGPLDLVAVQATWLPSQDQDLANLAIEVLPS